MIIKQFGAGYLVSVGNICAFGMTVAEAEYYLVEAGVLEAGYAFSTGDLS